MQHTYVESLILAQDKRWRRALPMRVGRVAPSGAASGDRVRNTWVTCPGVGDTRPKGWLIPHDLPPGMTGGRKASSSEGDGVRVEGPAAYQPDGGVTAYRGDDG